MSKLMKATIVAATWAYACVVTILIAAWLVIFRPHEPNPKQAAVDPDKPAVNCYEPGISTAVACVDDRTTKYVITCSSGYTPSTATSENGTIFLCSKEALK